jgi:hypothetical protein
MELPSIEEQANPPPKPLQVDLEIFSSLPECPVGDDAHVFSENQLRIFVKFLKLKEIFTNIQ